MSINPWIDVVAKVAMDQDPSIKPTEAYRQGLVWAMALDTLGHNLAVAGGLCEAWDQKHKATHYTRNRDSYLHWEPGCRKPWHTDPLVTLYHELFPGNRS